VSVEKSVSVVSVDHTVAQSAEIKAWVFDLANLC